MASVNLQDIAKRAGVSPATVSRALRGTYPVSQQALERIQLAMKELHYDHDEMLQRSFERKASPLRHTGNIGLILGDIAKKFSDPYWSGILDGVTEEVREQKYHLRFTFTRDDIRLEHQRRLLTHANIDGLLLVAKVLEEPFEHEIAPEFLVTVEYGPASPHAPLLIDNIEMEKWSAMRAMTEHLLRLGHRKFRFFTGEMDDLRTSGFVMALNQAGIMVPPEWCISAAWTTEAAYPVILSVLQQAGKQIDALVCASDLIAVAAYRAAAACGLRVPDDIAVTGFDDLPLVRDLDPPLTTVAVPKELLGRFAVRKLIERIQYPVLPPVVQLIPTTLVIRRSCGSTAS